MVGGLMFDYMFLESDEITYRFAFSSQTVDPETKEVTLEDWDLTMLAIDLFVDHLHEIAKEVIFVFSPPRDSPNGNFRDKIARTPGPNGLGYKAGRPPRPQNYQRIRDYICDRFFFDVVDHGEADDGLGMAAKRKDDKTVVLSHIDKDIDMIPGWHYNYVKKERYEVNEGVGSIEMFREKGKKPKLVTRGMIQFYRQLLEGDRVDNIPGIKGLGPVKIHQLFEGCPTEKQLFNIVLKAYRQQYKMQFINILLEVGDLLWIKQDENVRGSDILTCKLIDYGVGNYYEN